MGESYWLVKGRVSKRDLFFHPIKNTTDCNIIPKLPLPIFLSLSLPLITIFGESVSEGWRGGDENECREQYLSFPPSEMFGFRPCSFYFNVPFHLIFRSFDFFHHFSLKDLEQKLLEAERESGGNQRKGSVYDERFLSPLHL